MGTICCGVVGNRQPRSRDLTPIARVLLNLINTNVLPKGGHRESVPPGYAFVIYCLIRGIRISLPHLMISFMDHCNMDSKSAHTCAYPAAITAMLERVNMDMEGMEKTFVRSKVDTATLTRMGIKLPVDQREPLQVEASRATGTRTSAATSYRGEGSGHAEGTEGTGAADEATSRPPDLSRLREDVLAMKEQQAEMREQLSRIETSQDDMLHSLNMIRALIDERRQAGSAPAFRRQPPGVPTQYTSPNVGPSRVTIVPLEGDDGEESQPVDGGEEVGGQEVLLDVEVVTSSLRVPPTLGVEVPTFQTSSPPHDQTGQEPVQGTDQAEGVSEDQPTGCTEGQSGQVGHG